MFFKLKADYILQHVTEIDLQELKSKGVKALLFDLDNTIMAPRSGMLTEDIQNWLNEVQKDFKIAVVSNNRKESYLEKASKIIGCPVYGKAEKPKRRIVKKILNNMGLKPTEIAIVGDRPLTDIWVGKRLGSVTILVDPLMKNKEHVLVQFLRKVERSFMYIPEKV